MNYRTEDGHLVFTTRGTRLPLRLFVFLVGAATYSFVFLHGVAVDSTQWIVASLLALISFGVLTARVPDAIELKGRVLRIPLDGIRFEIKETESRGVRHVAMYRTLCAISGGRRFRLMMASGATDRYDRIPKIATELRALV